MVSIKFIEFEYKNEKKKEDIVSKNWKNVLIKHTYTTLQGTDKISTYSYLKERKFDYIKDTEYVNFYYVTLSGTKYIIHTFYGDDGTKYQGPALSEYVFFFENVKNVKISENCMEVMYKNINIFKKIKTDTKIANVTGELIQLSLVKSNALCSSNSCSTLNNSYTSYPQTLHNSSSTSMAATLNMPFSGTSSRSIESRSIIHNKNEIRTKKIMNLILLLKLI